MAVLGLAPTAVVATAYGFVPFVPGIVLPFATAKACRLATTRHAAYEDVAPAYAAFVQSLLVWLCLAGSAITVPLAFDPAVTVIPQIIVGGILALAGPGTAAQWADLPRQIYVPVQASPPPPSQSNQQVIAGTSVSPFEEVVDEQLEHFARKQAGEGDPRHHGLTDEEFENL